MNAQARDHLVQAYSDDAFLAGIVSEYVGAGLTSGEAAILIATPAHQDAFQARLAGAGIDVAQALQTGQLLCLDAERTLASFMVNGTPDRTDFMRIVVAGLDRVRRAGYRQVRCFGEMVDLLWRDDLPATMAVEALWNEVLADQRVSLLCAYRLDPLDRRAQGVLHQVTRCHSLVLPVEDADSVDAAIDRAWEDVFGVPGDAVTLRQLIVGDATPSPALPRAPATLLALQQLSPILAAQVLERGRYHFDRRRSSRARP
jgi:MEDS: MEthanogen/methylotroph, DcmR Sensory domain